MRVGDRVFLSLSWATCRRAQVEFDSARPTLCLLLCPCASAPLPAGGRSRVPRGARPTLYNGGVSLGDPMFLKVSWSPLPPEGAGESGALPRPTLYWGSTLVVLQLCSCPEGGRRDRFFEVRLLKLQGTPLLTCRVLPSIQGSLCLVSTRCPLGDHVFLVVLCDLLEGAGQGATLSSPDLYTVGASALSPAKFLCPGAVAARFLEWRS